MWIKKRATAMGRRNGSFQQWLKRSRQESSDWLEVELLRCETRPPTIVTPDAVVCSLLSLCVSAAALFRCAEGGERTGGSPGPSL